MVKELDEKTALKNLPSARTFIQANPTKKSPSAKKTSGQAGASPDSGEESYESDDFDQAQESSRVQDDD